MRKAPALSVLLSLPGCSTRLEREAAFDGQLSAMAGALEAGPLNGMGCIPDNSHQLGDDAMILQWRWDTSYIDPGTPPMYQRFGGWGWGDGGQKVMTP